MWDGTQVVVTGAGGFIGSQLVDRLLDLGARVTAFVRYSSRTGVGLQALMDRRAEALQIVLGDVTDLEAVRQVARGADVIFHLAALVGVPYSHIHPNEVVHVNTMGTLNVLTAAKEARPRKLVIASTSDVYGTALYVPVDERHPKQPQSPYAASKIAADAIALSFYQSFGLPVAIVRPFNTYGPRQSDRAIIPAVICQALVRSEVLVGNTTPTRDFTYVGDTVDGFLAVAASERSVGEEVNLGTGREVPIGDLVAKIAAVVGRDVRVRRVEERVRPAPNEVERMVADNTKVRHLAGWQPRVDLDQGLGLTVEWIRHHLRAYSPERYQI